MRYILIFILIIIIVLLILKLNIFKEHYNSQCEKNNKEIINLVFHNLDMDILINNEYEFPRILKYRGIKKIKGNYFGPFVSPSIANYTLISLQKAFLLRSCSDNVFNNRTRPCLLYDIKRCSAPCVNFITKEKYQESIQKLMGIEILSVKIPEEVEITTQLTIDEKRERGKRIDRNSKEVARENSGFHEKIYKNLKVNDRDRWRKERRKKYKKPKSRGDKGVNLRRK